MKQTVDSWGRYPKTKPGTIHRLADRSAPLPATSTKLLAFGNGRSYGDVCLSNGGDLLLTRGLNRFIHFDTRSGVIRAEAGVLLADILEVCVPQGWFLPVTPGTRYVTLGGAVANDVHGKNHHRAGTFGSHVLAFELLRSDGERRLCSPVENQDLFAATIAGLGLTGLICWVELQLQRIKAPWIQAENKRFTNVGEFFKLSADFEQEEFSVSWVDCSARGPKLGRGIFTHGNFTVESSVKAKLPKAHGLLTVPTTPPCSFINNLSVRLFNSIYYRQPDKRYLTHYQPFFYPLDGIRNWNRIYGPKGFLQYQCVIPNQDAEPALREILERIASSGQGSFLAVLKMFGSRPSPGMLSFPRPGVTIALDFPNRGKETADLLNELDAIVTESGGAIYPAKDARMSADMFSASFAELENFLPLLDPAFESAFFQRVVSTD